MKTIEIETPLRRPTVSKAERRIAEAHQPTKIQRTSHFCIVCHAEWTLEIIICFIKEDHHVSVYRAHRFDVFQHNHTFYAQAAYAQWHDSRTTVRDNTL